MTKLAIAFEFFDDKQDAVNSFFPDRALKAYDVGNFVEHEDDRQHRQPDHDASFGAAC